MKSSAITDATGFIDISGIERIVYPRLHLVSTTSHGGIAFYDSNEAFISGVRCVNGADSIRAEMDIAQVPNNAKYVRLSIVKQGQKYLYDYAEYVEGLDNKTEFVQSEISQITDKSNFNLNDLSVRNSFIDMTNGVIGNSASIPARLVVVPVESAAVLHVKIPHYSTKRIAFCDSFSNESTVYNAQQFVGALDQEFKNYNYKYFVIQLFINSDTDQDYTAYFEDAEIWTITAKDSFARSEIAELKQSVGNLFVVENLKGIPILESFEDIEIVTAAYDNCAAFHQLVKTQLCDDSNGYVVQTLLGTDGHGNNLYKYVTNPKTLKYGANRRFGTPDYPILGGTDVSNFTVILTSNIHGIEHGANWVVYNLLKKMQNADTDMLQFFRDYVRIVWVPYICASGEYENADGININRGFPVTIDGACASAEGNLVKAVIDEYAPGADLHIDIHTFDTSGTYAQNFASWTFTDSEKLGERSVRVAQSVVDRYARKYPNIDIFNREVVSAVNTPTTCTYYTQTVYGIPSGTIEGALSMSGSPEGTDPHTSATAYLYDIITQTICAMAD
jgi:hypothetical protein